MLMPVVYAFAVLALIGIGVLLGAAMMESEYKRRAKIDSDPLMEVVEDAAG